jgi:tetratricopeptide (TPR) repeat protein
MSKLSQGIIRSIAAASLIAVSMAVLIPGLSLPAKASDKQIDWDDKLAKERQLMTTNNIDEALKILDKYLEKHPESGACHTDKGKCLRRRGHVADAKSEFQRSTEVEPNYAEAWYELGAIQQTDKEYDMAVNSFERYLQIVPGSDKKDAVKDRINFCKSQM